jgi:hypothetical protein
MDRFHSPSPATPRVLPQWMDGSRDLWTSNSNRGTYSSQCRMDRSRERVKFDSHVGGYSKATCLCDISWS